MAFFTRYGTQHGVLPQTAGNVFYIAPSVNYSAGGQSCIADNGNSGLSPGSALLTPHALFTSARVTAGDTIVFLPGAHSWTSALAVNIAGVTLTGVTRASEGFRGRKNSGGAKLLSSITATTAVMTVTAADVEIAHLHVVPAATLPAVQITNAAADRVYIHDCTFSMFGTGDTNTMCIYLGAAVNDTVIANCFFHNVGGNGPAILLGDFVTVDTLIENCTFYLGGDTAWADGIKTIAVSLGNVIRDCDFLVRATGVAMTDGIDITSSTTDGGSTVLRCYFAVGCALTNANVADNQVAESYTLQAASSVGGTLILST